MIKDILQVYSGYISGSAAQSGLGAMRQGAQSGLGAMRQGASSNWGKVRTKMDIKNVPLPNVKKPELEFRYGVPVVL